MKIVMFSMTPLFEHQSMGGAQKQLKKVALHLAEMGHAVTILCTRRPDARHRFTWHPNLEVVPIYRFKQPFPEPYATPVYNIAAAIQDTGDYLAQADVFYSHDGGLIFPYVYQDTPTVVSLRSVVFSETLQSGFLFQGDALIVPSEHARNVWQHTVGRFFPALSERVHVIHNGLDFDIYRPTQPDAILQRIPVDPARHAIALYPHRPEEAKGIRQTIAVADKLVHQHGIDTLRVLLPQWIDTGVSAAVREFYDDLRRDLAQRGLSEHFVFHDWISDALMPDYLSLGDLTFVLGNYVETFGNVPYESIACGTRPLVARVGPYRDMLPDGLVDLVDYGDLDSAAHRAAAILREKRPVSDAAMAWLHGTFAQTQMVAAYADIILNARPLPPMPYRHTPLEPQTRYVAAPWCYATERGVWHDFRGDYSDDPTIVAFYADELVGSPHFDFEHWYREGYIVPMPAQVRHA